MKLPSPPQHYQPSAENNRNRILQLADQDNYKKTGDLIVDGNRLVLRDSTGAYWQITVSPSGTLSATAVNNIQ
jgi:hypothetical protein